MGYIDIEPTAPEVLRDPYPYFARARREGALLRVAPKGFLGVTRHADVTRVLEDAATFSSRGWRAALPDGVPRDVPLSFIELDGAQHQRQRRLVSKAFTPKVVQALEGGSAKSCASSWRRWRAATRSSSCATSPSRCR